MPRKIDNAVRERAMRMLVDHRQDYPSDTALAEAVAKKSALAARLPPLAGAGTSTPAPAGSELVGAGGDHAPEGGGTRVARGQRDPASGLAEELDSRNR